MNQEQVFRDVDVGSVPAEAEKLKGEGYRMVQISGTPYEGSAELLYSFDKDLSMVNLRTSVPNGTHVGSITPSYWSAFIYENEIHDLFGVEFDGMVLDYKGNFFRTGQPAPWRKEAKGGE